MALWPAISAAVGYLGASAQRRAQNRAIDEQMRLLEAQAAYRDAIQSMRAVPSSLLKAAHEQNLAEILRDEQSGGRVLEAEARSRGASPGRAASARWGMRLRADRARAAESLGYASAEEERQNRLLAMLESAGRDSTMAMAALEGEKGQVKSDFLGDIGSIIGHERGVAESKTMLDKILGTYEEGEAGAEGGTKDTDMGGGGDVLGTAGVRVPRADTSVPGPARERASDDLGDVVRRRRRTTMRERLGYREVPDFLARLEDEEEEPYGNWGRRGRLRLTI